MVCFSQGEKTHECEPELKPENTSSQPVSSMILQTVSA
jgi:hypothetical protein